MSIFAAANGVVIATEKKLPSILVDETSVSVANSFLYFLFCCNMSFHCSQKCLTNTFPKNSRCKRFRLWHQILELSTGTTLSWLMSYSFYFHILELECTVIILKFIILLLKLWTFAASFQLPSPSLILFTLDYFQWYGSRFPCSGEKKPKAGATVLSVVQGILLANCLV